MGRGGEVGGGGRGWEVGRGDGGRGREERGGNSHESELNVEDRTTLIAQSSRTPPHEINENIVPLPGVCPPGMDPCMPPGPPGMCCQPGGNQPEGMPGMCPPAAPTPCLQRVV